MLCRNCVKPLTEAQWDEPSKRYKSCPKCSERGGQEHVFYPYPAAFGTTDARASDLHTEGPQSWCKNCRQWGSHRETPRRCSASCGRRVPSRRRCDDMYGAGEDALIFRSLEARGRTERTETRRVDQRERTRKDRRRSRFRPPSNPSLLPAHPKNLTPGGLPGRIGPQCPCGTHRTAIAHTDDAMDRTSQEDEAVALRMLAKPREHLGSAQPVLRSIGSDSTQAVGRRRPAWPRGSRP